MSKYIYTNSPPNMIDHPCCQTCKRTLGHVAEAFRLKRQKLTADKLDARDEYTLPSLANVIIESNAGFESEYKAELGEFIRNSLKLEMECCAKTLLTNVQFTALYGK